MRSCTCLCSVALRASLDTPWLSFTYAAAAGVGGIIEFKEGPISTFEAAGSGRLKVQRREEAGLAGVLGASIRYVPPARFELSVNGGLGAAARVEMYEVGLESGKLP